MSAPPADRAAPHAGDRPDTTATFGDNHQHYFVEIPGFAYAAPSVQSFEVHEALGDLYRAEITLTHPDPLARGDVLNREATFSMLPMLGTPRRFAGCVTAFSRLQRTRDGYVYRLVIEPHVARLRHTPASRIFQKQKAPAIVEAILRRHGFKGHQFAFRLRRDYVEHDFRLQYQVSDWHYIRVLMEQEGLYCFVEHSEHGDVVVFADDVDHYTYQPTLTLPYREPAGLNPDSDAILSLQTHTQTVPASYRVADYNPDAAWERIQADANIASKDTTTYGQPYIYATGHRDQAQATWQAQLRHEAAISGQVRHQGTSTSMQVRPGRVTQTDEDVPESPHGMLITAVVHTGGRDTAYGNAFTAIPADRRFRLPLNEAAWPTITGTLSARVTSPSHYTYAYLTKAGYYVVRFDLDVDPWNPCGESVPLRLAKPFAGKLQTGMHFPALDGDEAVIAFRDGDPNKPYIAAFHHNSIATDLITQQDRWMSRNVIRTQADNKMQMEDWEGQEHVKLSTEHSGKSQLHLGHIVNGKREKRGEGFELRTSAYGALRAGRGLLLTTHDQPQAKGTQLDMREAMQQLTAAQSQMAQLAQAAQTAQADAADAKAMNAVLQQQLKDLQQAVMVLSAQSSIALTSPETLQHSAGKNLTFAAGENADMGVLRKFTVAAGEAISLFAQKRGIKLFANQGKVDIQAQGDALALAALKDVTVTSTNGRLVLTAKEEVWIGAGGSYIKINGNRIESGTPGDIYEKCAWWGRQEPSSFAQAMNTWKHAPFDEQFVLRWPFNNKPVTNRAFKVVRDDGSIIKGATGEAGTTELQKSLFTDGLGFHPDPT